MYRPLSIFLGVSLSAAAILSARAQNAPAQTPYAPGTLTGVWIDASVTATTTASSPAALAATGNRSSLSIFNLGTVLACMNFSATATINGTACGLGSIPIPAGGAILYDQPGFVSPEAVSVICTTGTCPLTVKTH